jgi:bifunctional enzyme CysN/CysC
MVAGKPYYLKQAAKTVTGSVAHIQYRIDVNTLERHAADHLLLNEIGLCEVALSAPQAFDSYGRCKATSPFILIDRITNGTVGAGMITGPAETAGATRRVTPEERAARFGQKAVTLWLRGENARDLAYQLDRRLFDLGQASTVLDDETAAGKAPVREVILRHLTAAGLICIAPLDHPSAAAPAAEDTVNWVLETRRLDVEEVLKLLRQRCLL